MLKGWRTLAINGAMALVLVTDYLIAQQSMAGTLLDNPKHAALAVLVVNIINIVLRFVTTGPVGGRKDG